MPLPDVQAEVGHERMANRDMSFLEAECGGVLLQMSRREVVHVIDEEQVRARHVLGRLAEQQPPVRLEVCGQRAQKSARRGDVLDHRDGYDR